MTNNTNIVYLRQFRPDGFYINPTSAYSYAGWPALQMLMDNKKGPRVIQLKIFHSQNYIFNLANHAIPVTSNQMDPN